VTPRYQHYNEEARRNGSLSGPFGFYVFRLFDVDDEVARDREVVSWAAEQGTGLTVDDGVWNHPVTYTDDASSYPHRMVIDGMDSAIVLIRDADLAMAFKLKFC
jgi:hypothetical protein